MTIAQRILEIKTKILQCETRYQRQPNTVQLIAVSKKQPVSAIEEAFNAGVNNFGESYLQEALPKIEILSHLPLTWHFIGPIQSNKTKGIAENFSWVHSVCRPNIAQLLNHYRSQIPSPLQICIQINLDDETSKSGLKLNEIEEFVQFVSRLPNLNLRGLMCIPKQETTVQQQYVTFKHLADLMHNLNAKYNLTMDTLSMGMSQDIEPAIQAGSTIVRIGRAIFGDRQ